MMFVRSILSLIIFFYFATLQVFSQTQPKIVLVLSGGGAKGLAHLGVIRALEEDSIPIHAIVGTSMGAMIGGGYAAGMSPSLMQRYILSPDFSNWVYGRVPERYKIYHQYDYLNSSVLSLKLDVDTALHLRVKKELMNDAVLNWSFSTLFDLTSIRTGYKYDSMMVPYRCISSEVFTQSSIVIDSGIMSRSMRATMSVPLFYSPIRVNGMYLFDGGIYNNFPISTARDLYGDSVIIIGVNVSSKNFISYPTADDSIAVNDAWLYMMLSRSDSTELKAGDIFIQPNLSKYSATDFGKADTLIALGYKTAKAMMPKIKAAISQRQLPNESYRSQYAAAPDSLLLDRIEIKGLTERQEGHIKGLFYRNKKPLTFGYAQAAYYRLVQEGNYRPVFPNILFDPSNQRHYLSLEMAANRLVTLDVGGCLATRGLSQIYLSSSYNILRKMVYRFTASVYAGQFYNALQAYIRIIPPVHLPFYIEPIITLQHFDYLSANDFYFAGRNPAFIRRFDLKQGLRIIFPIKRKNLPFVGIYNFNKIDKYFNERSSINTDTVDRTQFYGLSLEAGYERNSLNHRQYATKGMNTRTTLKYHYGKEFHVPGSTSIFTTEYIARIQWVVFKSEIEYYAPVRRIIPGFSAEFVGSGMPVFRNYTSTLLMSPAYFPMYDSRGLFLTRFRALSYFAASVKMVLELTKSLNVRLETHMMQPFNELTLQNDQTALMNTGLNAIRFAGTAQLVYHSAIGPAALSLNYYDDPRKPWGVFFHLGYFLQFSDR